VEVAENGHLTLPYKFTGNPRPTGIIWLHDDFEIHKYNSSALILHNVKLSDAGEYRLVVKSAIGEAQASFLLSVLRKYTLT
jgi:hypothetical protein